MTMYVDYSKTIHRENFRLYYHYLPILPSISLRQLNTPWHLRQQTFAVYLSRNAFITFVLLIHILSLVLTAVDTFASTPECPFFVKILQYSKCKIGYMEQKNHLRVTMLFSLIMVCLFVLYQLLQYKISK